MRTLGRFALGLVLGCILLVWAVALAATGHGTVAPLTSGFPELFLILVVAEGWGLWGFWLVVVPIAGLLWAAYFGVLPAIKSFDVRVAIMIIVCLVHVGAGVFTLFVDPGFLKMIQAQPVFTIGYFIFLSIVMFALGARTWAGPDFRFRNPGSS